MKYTIDWSEKKTTSTGKLKIDATLKDAEGKVYENVTLWADFPNFDKIMTGHSVEGDLVGKDYKGKNYFTLYPPKNPNTTWKPKPSNQEKVSESVQHAQDRKEQSIKIASTASGATQILVALIGKIESQPNFPPDNEWQKKWLEIRDFLWSKYDTDDTKQTPF